MAEISMMERDNRDLPSFERSVAPSILEHEPKAAQEHVSEVDHASKVDMMGDAATAQNATVGVVTPLLIILCFLLALATAVGHWLFFHFLNDKLVQDSIPQNYVTSISTALARLFSISLTVSASMAFVQLSWWTLRRRYMSISTIDNLFAVPSNPFKLFYPKCWRQAPLLWTFGLLFPLIPIATIFPPGGIIVATLPTPTSALVTVPSWNATFPGAEIDFGQRWFSLGADGEYRGANLSLTSLAKRSVIGGRYITMPSPCGPNCTFAIEVPAPSFACTPGIAMSTSDFAALQNWYFSNTSKPVGSAANSFFDPVRWSYIAQERPPLAAYATIGIPYSINEYRFDLAWNNILPGMTTMPVGPAMNMSCIAHYATYNLDISFVNNIQSVEVSIEQGDVMNGTALSMGEFFYAALGGRWPDNEPLTPDLILFDNVDLATGYFQQMMHALKDAVVNVLAGTVEALGTENQFISNTLIAESPLFNSTDNSFILSPSILQAVMTNYTISLLSLGLSEQRVQATTVTYHPTYVFAHKAAVFGPYVASLAVGLVLILSGLVTMYINGVSADTGFLQFMCTTSHTRGELRSLAMQNCLGGNHNARDELRDLKVIFGQLDKDTSDKLIAGFGTKDDCVHRLTRRRKHGDWEDVQQTAD